MASVAGGGSGAGGQNTSLGEVVGVRTRFQSLLPLQALLSKGCSHYCYCWRKVLDWDVVGKWSGRYVGVRWG